VELRSNGLLIPAMRLETHLTTRSEPVTYWIRVGSKLVRGNIELGLARVSYGVQGEIADGLLFRVSSIDSDASNAYRQQEKFIEDLIAAMPPEDRSAVLGDVGR
ncbi:MAG TPA: EpsI family protein, partial [Rhodocyclaceae bacterium]|nr:EpsI family protein [Rhodocyclaceae bacterium]